MDGTSFRRSQKTQDNFRPPLPQLRSDFLFWQKKKNWEKMRKFPVKNRCWPKNALWRLLLPSVVQTLLGTDAFLKKGQVCLDFGEWFYGCFLVKCVCMSSTYQCCSALLSILGHTHTSHLYTRHSCCTVDGRLSDHRRFPSSPPRSDTYHRSTFHGCHSLLHTPL